MIDFSSKTYSALLQSMLDRIPDTYDKRDTSPIPTALSPAAYALEDVYLTLYQMQLQSAIQTATGESLDNFAPLANITRKVATPAVRLGIFNTAVPIGSRFSTVNGGDSINFTVTAATQTQYQYQLTAETAGSIGNDYTGALLPITTIPALTSAQITTILVAGADAETDDAFRARLIESLNDKPFGGNIASYKNDISSIDGVGAVQVYPTWNGGGTVKCSVIGADWLPASSTLVENIQNAIDPPTQGLGLGLAPIGAQVTIVAPTAIATNVSATVILEAGYSLSQVQPLVQTAIDAYLLSVRQSWATQLGTIDVSYAADVYLSRVIAAIVDVTGIANATNVTINGNASDLILTENSTTQQVPVLGTVTLSE